MTARNDHNTDDPSRIDYAGADRYARRLVADGEVHWFYGPRLRPSIDRALPWCGTRENRPAEFVDTERITTDVVNGVPCPTCSRLASLATGRAAR